MDILVFSDSHGKNSDMFSVIRRHRSAEIVFFLGDGLWDMTDFTAEFPDRMLYAVRGNCDMFSGDTPAETVISLAGKRFFLCHGHTTGVKSGLTALEERAIREKADVALFGHTHEAFTSYISDAEHPFYLMNPGSISRSPDGKAHYGLITIQNGELLLSTAVFSPR